METPSGTASAVAAPLLRKALLNERSAALRRHGSTAIGLTRPPAREEQRSRTPSSLNQSRSSGSECLGVGIDSMDLLLHQSSVHLKLARQFGRQRSSLDESLQRPAHHQQLRRTSSASTTGDVRSSVAVENMWMPGLHMVENTATDAADVDRDLELRLFAALLPDAGQHGNVPRQGLPIPASQDKFKDDSGAHVPATPSRERRRRRHEACTPQIVDDRGDNENRLQRKGTGFVHLDKNREAARVQISDSKGDNENNIKRKGTGFIRLNKNLGHFLSQIEDMVCDDCDLASTVPLDGIASSTQPLQIPAGGFTDSWNAAEVLNLSSRRWLSNFPALCSADHDVGDSRHVQSR